MAERNAMESALQWLARQPYSVLKLRQRLEGAGFGPEATADCLARLTGWGYLDDRKFAAGRTGILKRRLKSRAYVEQDLAIQGIDERLIGEVLASEYPLEQELEIVRALLAKGKAAGNRRDWQDYQRLARAGFAEETLRKSFPELSSP